MRSARIGLRLAAVASLAVFAFGCADEPAEPAAVDLPAFAKAAAEQGPQATEHHLVLMSAGAGDLAGQVAALGGTVVREYGDIGVAMVSGLDDDAAAALQGADGIQRVARDLMVQWTPEDVTFEAAEGVGGEGHVPGHDPTGAVFFPCQWNMTQANCEAAWLQGQFGDPDVKVAVLDTGVDPFHVDLAGQIDIAQSVSMLSATSVCDLFVDDVGTINDYRYHGAFVAGIIAGAGNLVTGVAPRTQIVGVKVLNCLGSGSFADVIAGIMYAASLTDVHVINMSLGARFPKNSPGAGALVAALNKAVNHAVSQGKAVVSSAGNNGADLDHDRNVVNTPAQSGSGISAWAGNVNGDLASYSNYGRSGTWVGAGGGDGVDPNPPLPGCGLPAFGQGGIVSVCSSTSLFFGCGAGNFVLFNGAGTSFSAPLVSGVAALVDGMNGGALNNGQIRAVLAQTADDLGKKGVDGVFSHGRVNAGNAVN